MSVVGIDFGTRNGVVAVARRGGIDVVDNEASNRVTPTTVVFTERQRLAGEAAAVNHLRSVRSACAGVKRLLGARAGDPAFAGEIARQTCPVSELPDGGIGLRMQQQGGDALAPEQVAAIVLGHLKTHAERATQASVRDVVVSVPGHWSERQRRAMLDAATIAGLNVLRLVNEHTAAALAYGIYKTDLHETEPRKGLFVDVGHSATTATVTAFVKGKLTVLSAAFDPELGGRNFDELIAHALADEAKPKLGGVDPRENVRAWQRLLVAAEKQVKRVISAGTPRASVAVDNLANDRDFMTTVTKERFVEIVTPLLDRVTLPIQRALDAAGVKPEELAFVECLGGGMRLPQVQERVSALLGRPLDKTLNMEEVVARGCALMCAMLSPVFRVREFKVEDLTPYPIRLAWKTIGEDASSTTTTSSQMDDTDSALLIPQNGPLPAPKMVSFARTQPIEFTARYENPTVVPCAGEDGWIGTYRIEHIPPATLPGETPKIKVKARLSPDGTFAIEEAEVFDTIEETVEIEETVPAPATSPQPQQPTPAPATGDAPQDATFTTPSPSTTPAGCTDSPNPSPVTPAPPAAADVAPASPATATVPAPAPADATAAAPTSPAPAASPAKRKRTEVRKKVVHKPLKVVGRGLGLSKAALQRFIEAEGKMAAADKLAIETGEAKNHLESYSYTMRDKLSDANLGKYGVKADVDKLLADLDAARDWLYGDGEDQTKGVYVEKLKGLQSRIEPIVRRKTEADARPAAISALEVTLQQLATLAVSQEEKYSHIEPAERAKVSARVGEVLAWLAEKRATQDALPPHAEPILTVAMLAAKRAETAAFCEPIMNRPKPPPPKPATPPPAPAAAPAADGTAAPAEGAPAPAAPQQPPPAEAEAEAAATAATAATAEPATETPEQMEVDH